MCIVVKKDGKAYHKFWYYDEEKDFGEYKEKEIVSLIDFLSQKIKVEEGVTFEQFFDLIMNESEIMSKVFVSQLGHYHLSLWKEEWEKPAERKEYEHQIMDRLQVGWSVERWRSHKIHDKQFDFKDHIEEYIDFSGHGSWYDEYAHNLGNEKWAGEWVDGGISISFTPLYQLKKYPFEINTKWTLWDWGIKPDVKDKVIVESKKEMTVYDVIGAILFELTFYGNPDQRDETIKEIDKSANEMKKVIDEKGVEGAVKDGDIISYKDVFDKK